MRRRALAVVVVYGLIGLATAASASAAPPAPAATAQAWYQQVVTDLSPLQTSLVSGVQAAASWSNGSETARTARRQVESTLAALHKVSLALDRLPALSGYPDPRQEYVDAIALYRDAFGVDAAATLVSAKPLVEQLQRGFERVRQLGDLTFDQGTAELAPLLGGTIAGTDVAAASHLPNWSALNLAPGRPLMARWHGTSVQPSGTQSASGWATALAQVGAPTQATVRAAVAGRRASRPDRQRVAAELDAAEVSLSSVPPPSTDPQATDVDRLGLLVDAEAVLSAEAARLSPSAPSKSLATTAVSLQSIGAWLRSAA